MAVLNFKAHRSGKPSTSSRSLSASNARLNNEITFLKSLITESELEPQDKVLMISDLMRISGLMLGIWARYSFALAEKRIGPSLGAANEAGNNLTISPSDNAAKGSDHGN